jgi:RNA polymerase sigma-70 factor (ECF subfamily)
MAEGEKELWLRAQRGDEHAVETLYHNYYRTIYTYVYYRVGDGTLAEDLTAEVFLRLVDHISEMKLNGKPPLAWMYTISRNLVIDHFRHDPLERSVPLDDNLMERKDLQPEVQVEYHLNQDRLREALNYLTEPQRQVVLMKFIEHRSNAEIASVLGKEEGAIKSIQHRALDSLKRVLESKVSYGS